jgi:sigma-B regulation protein RsbQ
VSHYLEAHLPDATLRMLDAAGHCPHMSHPEATTTAIEAYLSSADASS